MYAYKAPGLDLELKFIWLEVPTRHSSFCLQLGNGGLQFKKALDNTDADQFETPSVVELGFAKLCTVAQQMASDLQTSYAEATQAGIIWVETCSMVLEWPMCSDKPNRLLPTI